MGTNAIISRWPVKALKPSFNAHGRIQLARVHVPLAPPIILVNARMLHDQGLRRCLLYDPVTYAASNKQEIIVLSSFNAEPDDPLLIDNLATDYYKITCDTTITSTRGGHIGFMMCSRGDSAYTGPWRI